MRLGNGLAGFIFAFVWLAAGLAAGVVAEHQFVADSTFYYRTGRQAIISTRFNFNDPRALKEFPLFFGEWEGVDLTLVNQPVVKPDFMFERNYWRQGRGEPVWFQLIRGRIERAVHVPAICYYNAGWQILEHEPDSFKIGRTVVPCGRMTARRGDRYATELYFYLWEDPKRDFMKGCVMFRVASMGPQGNPGEKAGLLKEFIQDVLAENGGKK